MINYLKNLSHQNPPFVYYDTTDKHCYVQTQEDEIKICVTQQVDGKTKAVVTQQSHY